MKLKFITAGVFMLLLQVLMFGQNGLKLVEIANGYNKPLDIQHAGDNRLFIVTQPGVIWIIDSAGNKLSTPFLDINDKVINTGNERGLLGLAFHPDYKQNGYFYVNYIGNDGNTKISRFNVSGNPDQADPNSELLLMGVTQPFQNHNGGCLHFGQDGYLYIGLGDGGSGGDPQANSQNPQKLLGKILRIDVNNGSPYSIPSDNPFINSADTLKEIWSLGWRNPWRFSFDRITGDMWIGDVGQDNWEEIDFEPKGAKGGLNYGWRCYEGNANFNTTNCGPKDSYVFPVFAYDQNSGDCSVTGGYVYRGTKYPGLHGKYIYADYCSGKIHVISRNSAGQFSDKVLADLTNLDYSSFGEDLEGELYISGLSTGKIFSLTLDCPVKSTQYENTNPCNDTLTGSIKLTEEPGFSYIWNTGDTTSAINNVLPGNYSVTIIDNSSFCAEVIPSIVLESWPKPDVLLVWSDSLLSLSGNFVFENIQWFQNGVMIPGANSTSYKPIKSGNYSAGFTIQDSGCSYATDTLNIIITSQQSVFRNPVQYVYPDPAQNSISINWHEPHSVYSYTIFDYTGKTLQSEKNKTSNTINIEKLTSGLYLMDITCHSGRQVLKFQKK